jgi:hypothetical protein
MQIEQVIGQVASKGTVNEGTLTLHTAFIQLTHNLAVQLRELADNNNPAAIATSDAVFVSKSGLDSLADEMEKGVAEMTEHAPDIYKEDTTNPETVREATVSQIAAYVKATSSLSARLGKMSNYADPEYQKPGDAVFVSRNGLIKVQTLLQQTAAELTAHAPSILQAVLLNTPQARANVEKIIEANEEGAAAGADRPFGTGPGRFRSGRSQTYSKAGEPNRTARTPEDVKAAEADGYTLVNENATHGDAWTFVKAGSPDLTVKNANEEEHARQAGYTPELFGKGTETVDPRTGRARNFDPATGQEVPDRRSNV